MSSFVAKMRLKEMAEEDIYFARLDRQLIEALRAKKRQREQETSSKVESPESATTDR